MARKIIHLVKDPSSIIKSLGPGDAFLHQWTGTSLRQVGYHRRQGMTWTEISTRKDSKHDVRLFYSIEHLYFVISDKYIVKGKQHAKTPR